MLVRTFVSKATNVWGRFLREEQSTSELKSMLYFLENYFSFPIFSFGQRKEELQISLLISVPVVGNNFNKDAKSREHNTLFSVEWGRVLTSSFYGCLCTHWVDLPSVSVQVTPYVFYRISSGQGRQTDAALSEVEPRVLPSSSVSFGNLHKCGILLHYLVSLLKH